jgi:hypothetical protein
MIKISLKSLINLLIANGHKFTIERSTKHTEQLVLAFVVGHNYPDTGSMTFLGHAYTDMDSSMREVKNKTDGKIVLLYNTNHDVVVAITGALHELINDLKKQKQTPILTEEASCQPTLH